MKAMVLSVFHIPVNQVVYCAGALDIGITTPAVAPGGDAAQDMYERKFRERQSDMADLADRNIVYKPLIWTCFGRPHG